MEDGFKKWMDYVYITHEQHASSMSKLSMKHDTNCGSYICHKENKRKTVQSQELSVPLYTTQYENRMNSEYYYIGRLNYSTSNNNSGTANI